MSVAITLSYCTVITDYKKLKTNLIFVPTICKDAVPQKQSDLGYKDSYHFFNFSISL